MTLREEDVESRALLAADAAKLWGAALIEQLLALVRGVIVPRYLGPALYGALGALGLITKYGAYLQLGITTAVGREVPYALKQRSTDLAERLAKVGYSFNLLTSAAPAAVVAIYALATWGRYVDVISWGLLTFSFLLITTRLETYFTTVFRARRQFGAAFLFTAFKAVVLFALVVGFLFMYGLYGVFVGLVIGGAVVAAVGTIWTRAGSWPWPDWSLMRKLLPIGLPLAGIGALGFVLQSVDRLMVIHFFTPRDVGHYILAVTVVTFVYFLPMNVGQAMAPRIYALARDGDRRVFEEYLVEPSLFVTYLVASLGGLVIICLVPFIRYVLPAYGPSVPVVAALLVGITCQGGVQGGAHILIALGRFRTIAVAQGASLVLAFALIWFAVRSGWGLVGVAAGASAGLVTFACALQFSAWRLMSLPLRTVPRAFGYLLLPPAAVAAGLFFAFYVGSFLVSHVAPGAARATADALNFVFRVTLFLPTVAAFGFYVNRETGFVTKLWSLVKERLSARAR
ncbi:MAG: oligosaccharide flippase family protein [bacterium]